jgi:hypothetical protein
MKITLLLISLLLYRAIALCPTGLIVSETATTATIEFVNQPNVTCYVNYSIYTVSIPNTGSSFNVTIRGLTPATTYYYQVNCSNGSTICATATSKINTIARRDILDSKYLANAWIYSIWNGSVQLGVRCYISSDDYSQ